MICIATQFSLFLVFCVSAQVKLSVSLLYRLYLPYHCYVFVCILPEKAVSEMTYTVSGGMLNPTHSLTHSCCTKCLSSYHVSKQVQ